MTIIGAGIAGLAAAARLLKEGIEDVVVLEASSRVGGRIHSTDFNENGSIEMGAQWIHGETDNELYDIANGLGLTENPGDSVLEDLGEDFVDEEGDFWDDDLMDKLWEIADAAEDEQEDHSYDVSLNHLESIRCLGDN